MAILFSACLALVVIQFGSHMIFLLKMRSALEAAKSAAEKSHQLAKLTDENARHHIKILATQLHTMEKELFHAHERIDQLQNLNEETPQAMRAKVYSKPSTLNHEGKT